MLDKLRNARVHIEEVAYSEYYKRRFNEQSPGDVEGLEHSMTEFTDILFLCHGNICRSPFAEKYATNRFEDMVTVKSAGFYPETGRPSPTNAVRAAGEFQIDLTDHVSSVVTQSDIESADITFLMDFKNVHYLLSNFDVELENVYLLGEFNDRMDSNVIGDPHGSSINTFKEIYQEIIEAVDCLTVRLSSG